MSHIPEIEGVSYRQLDYWCRRGWLRPGNGGAGSGSVRHWPEAELDVAEKMSRLVAAGLTPAAAERVARGEPELAPGVRVELSALNPDGVA